MNCIICNNELKGKQKMFCTTKCKNQSTNNKNQNYLAQQKRGLERKVYLINLLGGCCAKCGYNKNIAAFEFHHNDPSKKEGQLDMRKLSNSSMEWIMKEVEKCQLLCSNCHKEHHSPDSDMILVLEKLKKD
jgi:hypothetical protein